MRNSLPEDHDKLLTEDQQNISSSLLPRQNLENSSKPPLTASSFVMEHKGEQCVMSNYNNPVYDPVKPFQSHLQRVNSMREPLQPKPNKKNIQEPEKTFPVSKPSNCSNIYGVVLDRAMSMRESSTDMKRNLSTAPTLPLRDEKHVKQRIFDERSWEEEVRRALEKNNLEQETVPPPMNIKPPLVPSSNGVPPGLQKSSSTREYGTSCGMPTTLVVRRSNGGKPVKPGGVFPPDVQVGSPDRGGGLKDSTVKSPGEKSWEEAEEYEERQEMMKKKGRGRSQSMRLDREAAEVALEHKWMEDQAQHPLHHDEHYGAHEEDEEEWAVYKRSGYINVKGASTAAAAPSGLRGGFSRHHHMHHHHLGHGHGHGHDHPGFVIEPPRRSASDACLSRSMSMSMRDSAMGVFMECSGCPCSGPNMANYGPNVTRHHIPGSNRCCCSCSCCYSVATNGCSHNYTTLLPYNMHGDIPPSNKKKGNGVIKACRKLLGLSKKRSLVPHCSHQYHP